ncbi:hypothetical protein DY000_02009324 [Brassica cretica]|uniref:Methyltransferase n=1 Tax=Brassica cretica TaxID=69181 RepID=A0ABQ7CJ89_BRACR|nr:hypothetical protein DY000_02009324 [Brassica cretica]
MESEREEVKNGGVEEDERALKRKREKEWAASSPPPLDDITDDQDNAFKVRGKNSRRIEVCRDCPYPRYSHRQDKKSLEEEKLKQEEKYTWVVVDGVKEKMVKPKNGIHPSDITMDIGKGVPVPECPFVGFGRKSAQKMTKVSSVSWTMLSTNPAGSYAMSVSLDKETTKEFMEKMDLEPRQKVLNVGCGTGGGNFYMA